MLPKEGARPLPVVEIFGPTIQGEAAQAGIRTMFIRFGFCDGAGSEGWCTWCDSMFAVDPKNKAQWKMMWPAEIMQRLRDTSRFCDTVTLSGGNPLLHELWPLIKHLRHSGYRINVETQGTIYKDWLTDVHNVTVSPKGPSAGSKCDLIKLDHTMRKLRYHQGEVVLKVVVDVEFPLDYQFAVDIFTRYPWVEKQYMSSVTRPEDGQDDVVARWGRLVDRVIWDDRLRDVGVLPQLHVLLWGHEQGV